VKREIIAKNFGLTWPPGCSCGRGPGRPQLLELAVQVGALQAGLFGHPRHRAAFLGQVKFEVRLLERVARLAQRLSSSKLRCACGVRSRAAGSIWPPVMAASTVSSISAAPIPPGARSPSRAAAVVVGPRSPAASALFNGLEQLCSVMGFSRKACAPMRGLDGGLDGGVAAHHDDGHGQQARAAPLLEQGDAVGVRHPDVEQHQIGAGVLRGPRLGGVLGQFDGVTLVVEDFRQKSRMPSSSSTTRMLAMRKRVSFA
jgi:hypothetical protein